MDNFIFAPTRTQLCHHPHPKVFFYSGESSKWIGPEEPFPASAGQNTSLNHEGTYLSAIEDLAIWYPGRVTAWRYEASTNLSPFYLQVRLYIHNLHFTSRPTMYMRTYRCTYSGFVDNLTTYNLCSAPLCIFDM